MQLVCIVCGGHLDKHETASLSTECKTYPAHDDCFNQFTDDKEFLDFAKGEPHVLSYWSGDLKDIKELATFRTDAKVRLKDVLAAAGAEYKAPEWFSLDVLKLMLPPEYVNSVINSATVYQRLVNIPSIEAARYGHFNDLDNTPVLLDGIVFGYAQKFQTHEQAFGFALFKNGATEASQGGFISLAAAQSACNDAAKDKISRLLT